MNEAIPVHIIICTTSLRDCVLGWQEYIVFVNLRRPRSRSLSRYLSIFVLLTVVMRFVACVGLVTVQ